MPRQEREICPSGYHHTMLLGFDKYFTDQFSKDKVCTVNYQVYNFDGWIKRQIMRAKPPADYANQMQLKSDFDKPTIIRNKVAYLDSLGKAIGSVPIAFFVL